MTSVPVHALRSLYFLSLIVVLRSIDHSLPSSHAYCEVGPRPGPRSIRPYHQRHCRGSSASWCIRLDSSKSVIKHPYNPFNNKLLFSRIGIPSDEDIYRLQFHVLPRVKLSNFLTNGTNHHRRKLLAPFWLSIWVRWLCRSRSLEWLASDPGGHVSCVSFTVMLDSCWATALRSR